MGVCDEMTDYTSTSELKVTHNNYSDPATIADITGRLEKNHWLEYASGLYVVILWS